MVKTIRKYRQTVSSGYNKNATMNTTLNQDSMAATDTSHPKEEMLTLGMEKSRRELFQKLQNIVNIRLNRAKTAKSNQPISLLFYTKA